MINDALRYMRVPPEARERDEILCKRVISGFERLNNIMRPRTTWAKFPVIFCDKNLEIAEIKINSANLKNLLKNSDECCLMAVTLGHEVDREIFLSQQRDISDGLIFDACASVMADVICDELEDEIKKDLSVNLTPRFSPGYGDVPLNISDEIIDVLNATKYIGLSVTRSGMLSPVKSITAFAGIINKNSEIAFKNVLKCADCENNKNCPYSKI